MRPDRVVQVLHKLAVSSESIREFHRSGDAERLLAWYRQCSFDPSLVLIVLPVLMVVGWPFLFRPVRRAIVRWWAGRSNRAAELVIESTVAEATVYLVLADAGSVAYWLLLSAAFLSLAWVSIRCATGRR